MMQLRDYQARLLSDCYAAWDGGAQNIMPVLPTGGGKTVIFARAMRDESAPSIAIAHRRELVGQMSLTLARNGIQHRIVGPDSLWKLCARLHVAELGRQYTSPNALRTVASVFSLAKVGESDPLWAQNRLWIHDEGHHILRDNVFGRVVSQFRLARGMAPTATACRSDGKGLGRHADGLVDALVEGPGMRRLIDRGFLTEYKIYAPPSDLDTSDVPISAGGDFSPIPLSKATMRSSVMGDAVQHYLRIAPGKLAVIFAPSVEVAAETAAKFRAEGVPAEVVTAKTPDDLRASLLRRFAGREIRVLINVALFDEGFDLPAIEVVIDIAKTMSYGRFAQRFGRMLRLLDGKERGVYIDHVGNVLQHGLPDAPRVWTLGRRERRSKSTPNDVIPLRTCPNCTAAYERIHKACPYCKHAPEPVGRGAPGQVDGDLVELDPAVLAKLRGEIARIDAPSATVPYGAPPEVVGALQRRHRERQQAQAALRETMAAWGGARTAEGLDIPTAQRLFYLKYGVDVATAQTLGRPEAEALRGRVLTDTAVSDNLRA